MVKTASEIISELSSQYSAPKNRLLFLERSGVYHKIIRGLYETEKNVSPVVLAASIYGPSYISFEYALSYWNLIPERVSVLTMATTQKGKSKRFDTDFGSFIYRDIPKASFPFEVYIMLENKRYFLIAGKEKAICDILYRESPLGSVKQLKFFLFENMRIEQSDFDNLDFRILHELCPLYKSTNLKLLEKFLEKTGRKL